MSIYDNITQWFPLANVNNPNLKESMEQKVYLIIMDTY
jgi:hypothetical protein